MENSWWIEQQSNIQSAGVIVKSGIMKEQVWPEELFNRVR